MTGNGAAGLGSVLGPAAPAPIASWEEAPPVGGRPLHVRDLSLPPELGSVWFLPSVERRSLGARATNGPVLLPIIMLLAGSRRNPAP